MIQETLRADKGDLMIIRNKWIQLFVLSGLILVLVMLLQPKNKAPEWQVSTEKLKERIDKDLPALNEHISDFEKVNLLREWAYANIDISSTKALLAQDNNYLFNSNNGYLLFSAFSEDRGGVWCYGAAIALMRLYIAYGFNASILDYGKLGVMTHVVTLVKINHDRRQRMVIQDATFNLTYVDPDGVPYDYHEFVKVLKKRQRDKIRVLQSHSKSGDFLLHPGDVIRDYNHIIAEDAKPILVMDNGIQKYRSELSLQSFNNKFGPRINKFLIKKGYSGDPIYLFLFSVKNSQS